MLSGLATQTDISRLLQRLAGPVTLSVGASTGTSDWAIPMQSISFGAGSPVPYNESLHNEFLKDFKEDLAEVELRLQRLKLVTARYLLP
jgi:hypothetical protein